MPEIDPYEQSKVDGPKELVVQAVEACERKYHNAFVEKVERRYDAYRGITSPATGGDGGRDVKDDWHSDITAPYILQTIEGMLATMLEPRPRCNVKPRPHPEEELPLVLERSQRAAVLEDVISYAFDRDHFAEKQRDFMQQDLIAGVTVMKNYWMSERRKVTRLGETTDEILDDLGQVVDTISYMDEETVETLIKDDACSEVRDVRDFFWPAQAPSIGKAEFVIDRTWESFPSCERKGRDGYYKNVSKLKETRKSLQDDGTQREKKLRNIDRSEGLVEILEYWTPERVITVGNRAVVLNDRPNPFWNGRIPFIVCSAMPDAFQIPGISVVEALAQLQEMLWTLQNQRLDVLRMLANLVTLVRSDVDDPDAFEWAPNAQWPVEDPGQIQQLPIDPTAATITLQAEALLKGDLQNIMGGLPMAGGVDSQSIDQETATGVSIITSIAQRIIQARKQHYLWAYAHLGKDFLLLWQQFVRDDRVVKVVGGPGAIAYKSVSPRDLQGDFDVTIDVTSDSLLRQERRAEAQAMMQLSASVQPIMAQSGAPLNLRAPYERVLDSFDVADKERYFMTAAPPQLAAATPGAPTPTGPGVPPSGNGVTNPEAAAGALSPSPEGGGPSMSPESMMATLMRQRGTPPSG